MIDKKIFNNFAKLDEHEVEFMLKFMNNLYNLKKVIENIENEGTFNIDVNKKYNINSIKNFSSIDDEYSYFEDYFEDDSDFADSLLEENSIILDIVGIKVCSNIKYIASGPTTFASTFDEDTLRLYPQIILPIIDSAYLDQMESNPTYVSVSVSNDYMQDFISIIEENNVILPKDFFFYELDIEFKLGKRLDFIDAVRYLKSNHCEDCNKNISILAALHTYRNEIINKGDLCLFIIEINKYCKEFVKKYNSNEVVFVKSSNSKEIEQDLDIMNDYLSQLQSNSTVELDEVEYSSDNFEDYFTLISSLNLNSYNPRGYSQINVGLSKKTGNKYMLGGDILEIKYRDNKRLRDIFNKI